LRPPAQPLDPLAIGMANQKKFKRGLTLKQFAFCREYVKDNNGCQAALRAGYSARRARHAASKLLRLPHVQAELQTRLKKLDVLSDVTVERVLTELARVAYADVTGVIQVINGRISVRDTDDLTRDQRAALAELAQTQHGIRVKTHDKTRALDLLGKYLALWTERTEVVGDPNAPLVVVMPPPAKPT
jgi:phage terminase small subunit